MIHLGNRGFQITRGSKASSRMEFLPVVLTQLSPDLDHLSEEQVPHMLLVASRHLYAMRFTVVSLYSCYEMRV